MSNSLFTTTYPFLIPLKYHHLKAKEITVSTDTNEILEEAFLVLEPIFEQYGKREVIDAIHYYFHKGSN